MLHDLRFIIRRLRRDSGSNAAAIAALSLAIAAQATVFSFIRFALLQPLDFQEPKRLVHLYETHGLEGPAIGVGRFTPANFLYFQEHSQKISAMAASRNTNALVRVPAEGEPEERSLIRPVSPGYFDLLGVEPLLGSNLSQTAPGDAPSVILTETAWLDLFEKSPDVIGKALDLDGVEHRVVGVMPASFNDPFFLNPPVLWRTLDLETERDMFIADSRARYGRLRVVARLADNARLEEAVKEFQDITRLLIDEHPEVDPKLQVGIRPLAEILVDPFRLALILAWFSTLLILLVACLNVANLLLARVLRRREEIAIRLALGAGRRHLLRQFLLESLALVAPAAVLGTALAVLLIEGLRFLLPPTVDFLGRLAEARIDLGVLLATCGVLAVITIVFSLLPLLQIARDRLVIGGGALSAISGRRGARLRDALVAANLALCALLLTGTGLILNGFYQLRNADLGLDPRNLLIARTDANTLTRTDPQQWREHFDRLLADLRAMPGIEQTAIASLPPIVMGWQPTAVMLDASDSEQERAMIHVASPGYFATLGMEIFEGRDFETEDAVDSEPVAVVSRRFARQAWPGQNALGRRVRPVDQEQDRVVVGVVDDIPAAGIQPGEGAAIYLPFAQQTKSTMSIFARTSRPPETLRNDFLEMLREASEPAPVYGDGTGKELLWIVRERWQSRLLLLCFGALAFAAVVLTSAGIYSVLSYLVAERTREIGLRRALGARPQDILSDVRRRAFKLAAIGIPLGLLGAALLAPRAGRDIPWVDLQVLWPYGAVAFLLLFVALWASETPARRAAQVEPAEALREH